MWYLGGSLDLLSTTFASLYYPTYEVEMLRWHEHISPFVLQFCSEAATSHLRFDCVGTPPRELLSGGNLHIYATWFVCDRLFPV